MAELPTDPPNQPSAARWSPLNRIDRRVVGVLVEKAKTTPDAYPLSLAALTTGCNQKSNRHPQMQLESEQVEQSLERLRQLGAVAEVSGTGRVPRYRHYLYEWLGVDKVELAVMAELLLRGPQTLGDLRARAARMEPIADQAALLPVVRSLVGKNLVIALTPPGRGQVVTHALYADDEMQQIRSQHLGDAGGGEPADSPPPAEPTPGDSGQLQALESQIRRLTEEVNYLRQLIQQIGERLADGPTRWGETD